MYLSIGYRTEFEYAELARQSHNELRATPTTDQHQRLLSYRLSVTPAARSHTYLDYWGTLVDAFGIRTAHDRLEIGVDAVVETHPPESTVSDAAPAALLEVGFTDEFWEYLQPSRHTSPTPELEAMAAAEAAHADGCRDLLSRLSTAVHGRLSYQAGATVVGESIDEVLAKGQGVCQDYAHLLVASARSVGLPCRYVSGYLYATEHNTAEEPTDDDAISVQTHAWVEAQIPGVGWVPCDPTNQQPVGEAHVKVGAGRDYDDVPPLKGIYTGGGDPTLSAEVSMRRLAEPQVRDAYSRMVTQPQQ